MASHDSNRLPPHPTQQFDAHHTVTLHFNGRDIPAHPGETVGSALFAAGVRTFSRSFKYHRPRGLFCAAGQCPNCLMNVNGTPNVRICTEPVQDKMWIKPQNAWPSLDLDLLSINDRLSFMLPVGFYYKRFIRPRFMWPLYEHVLRHAAGLGEIDRTRHDAHETRYEHLTRHADVAVVGGGPAGLSAALEAARTGARVVLIDDQATLGGHLRFQTAPFNGETGFETGRRLAAEVSQTENIEVFSSATAFGLYEDHLLGVNQGHRVIHVRARRIVVAAGAFERPFIFHNNDLPGVFLGRGVQRLIHLYGVLPGRNALVVSSNDAGLAVARDLLSAGVHVEAIAESRAEIPESDALAQVKAAGVPILTGHTIREAQGSKQVIGATLARTDGRGGIVSGSERKLSCDLIALSAGYTPAIALLHQGGCSVDHDPALGEIVAKDLPPDMFAAGQVNGLHDLSAILLDGRIAGLSAAQSLGLGGSGASETLEAERRDLQARRSGLNPQSLASQIIPGGPKKKFVCLCEDVTEKDLCDAIREGFDHIETLKRYSTVTMGPCQGRVCAMASIAITARETNRSISETGTTTSRPPFVPVTLGALAGPARHPAKRTPMHHRHVALGARVIDLGGWDRPEVYTTPGQEYTAVRQKVGVIDVSTLGKLDVRGRDAGALLDRIYLNTMSSLRQGRVRYGAVCGDDGIILDDGTVARLGRERFFITTTTGNIEFMEQWLTWWAAAWKMSVSVTNVTSAYAAVNVAGPRARDLLAKLTDLDLSTAAIPYMASARGRVAEVPALLLRIGFVGELGYEIHYPAEYGEHLWDAVMEAGRPFGIAPFAVETQRILRLEKRHIIVGQDTDALSNPLEADLGWMVNFDKPDFIGKRSILEVQKRGLKNRLVGIVMRDPDVVPEEGSQIVSGGKSVGRVTSARRSPHLGRGIGMAWVPAESAAEGEVIQIRLHERDVAAQVTNHPFYDPEGVKLRI
ncbi:MAG: FAD-dependent oxidoreductase [Candidatus Latescibacteria bacterium]|nr:FAD-dependent oxidoreductase [Candidatus Latescibacterota bacterium]